MLSKVIYLLIFLKVALFSCIIIDDGAKVFNLLDKKDNVFLNYAGSLNDPDIYNDIAYFYGKKNKEANLKEWQKALNNSYTLEEVEGFLYNKKNLNNLKDKEILNYFKFAQNQESCVTFNNFAEEKPKDCAKFIPLALDGIEKTQNSFLKLRYFYLALRLAHYHKENPIQIYEKYSYLLENSNSITKNWIEALYAGALIKSGKKIEGVYAFSKLFENSINYHLAFYNFFHIKSEDEFNSLLKLAKNEDEQTKMYMLRALNSKSNVIEEMENIYNIDKNSKWLDFLLFKELYSSFSNLSLDEEVDNSIFFNKYIEFLKNLKKDDKYLVDLSLAYFYIYTKDYEASKNILQNLKKEYSKNKEVDVASYILYLNSLNKIDLNSENFIFEELSKLSFEESIYKYTLRTLKKLYKKQGFLFDEFLVTNSLYLNYSSFDLEKVRRFDDFLNDSSKSKLKEHLKVEFKKVTNKKDFFDKDYGSTKVTVLINNLLFQEALDTNLDYLNKKLEFNPLNAEIKGNNRVKSKNSITIKEFLKNAIAIEEKLKKEPKSSKENFLYANIIYNLSYFGNSNKLATVYRTTYTFNTPKLEEERLNLAIKHYQIALNNSNDTEFKAKVSYQIAKMHLALFDLKYDENYYAQTSLKSDSYDKNQKYFYGLNDEFYEEFLKQGGAKHFDLIKKDYEKTKFYKEIIKECSDFKTYINSKK